MKRLFCWLILFSVILSAQGAGGKYNFSYLSLEDGLSQITVTAIHQDRQGYMWFGTRNGLNRYNGYEFEVFTHHPDDPFSITDNHILSITEDNAGNLWIGTNNGLNRLELSTYTFGRFSAQQGDTGGLSGNMISSLFWDEEQELLWIGTERGLSCYDRKQELLYSVPLGAEIDSRPVYAILRYEDTLYLGTAAAGVVTWKKDHTPVCYRRDSEVITGIPDNDIRVLYMDKQENLWIGTHHNGVAVLRKGSSQAVCYNRENGLTNDYIRCIRETPEGDLLIGTFNGLNALNPRTGDIIPYQTYDSSQGNLNHYSIYSIFFDRSRTLWVGTYAGGINYHSDYGDKFRFFNPGADLKQITGIIGSMLRVGDSLYIATEGGGLLEMNLETEDSRLYPLTRQREGGYAHNIIKCLYRDGERILCGTNVGTIYSFDLRTKTFSLFYDFKRGNAVYHISKNSRGEWMIGGVNQIGVTVLTPEKTLTGHFPLDASFSFYDVRVIYEYRPDLYLVGTRNDGLYVYDRNNQTVKQYTKKGGEGNPGSELPESYVTSILEDNRGRIWIGTFGGGIVGFDMERGVLATYDSDKGLHDNNICMLLEDDNHQIWLSTLSGIAKFNPENQTFVNYSYSAGIRVHEFTPHAGYKLSGETLFFSGNNGFTSFNPAKMTVNPYIPPLRLENLYIHNERIVPSREESILSTRLDEQKEIVLRYNQANFMIEYSALNYIFPDRNQYAYMLEGFDSGWNEVDNRRTAYYTNVPPGNYRFLVRGSNNDELWNLEGVSVAIRVLPPLWKTWWAYLLYVIVLLMIGWVILRYYLERKRLENEVKLKQAEAHAREEFHQERNKLFTNFSHELRTPLTLIVSPLEEIVQKADEFSDKIRHSHRLMYNNSLRLLRLVNNLMDFQKKESGMLQLKVTNGNYAAFSAEMCSLFTDLAESRRITLDLQASHPEMEYWFDRSLMEKVWFNFLSNAFKNVPDEGRIEIRVEKGSLKEWAAKVPGKRLSGFTDSKIDYILLDITDSGAGIPEEELEKIFAPFYQVAQNEHSVSGTGLGLSLSKSIIEMHHGVVWAESGPGRGASFRCLLPVKKELYSPEELVESYQYQEQRALQVEIKEDITRSEGKGKKNYTVLVVEDNPEVRNYVATQLCDQYHVLEAIHGEEGLDKAIYHLPDLIISDLMMPKMDGMELTGKLKSDLRTSHIPVILLTARTMAEDMREGYETGADDYITKPFSPAVLKARVENMIRSREKLKDIYGKQFSLETLGVERTSADDRFLQKLYQSMEKNISNPELNLESFCKEIGMSRANLYRKIKSLTGLPPSTFIRNFRLEMGAKILKEARLPVSDVFVAVGFSSHAYFSSCFKSLYNITPTEYAAQEQEKGE